MRVDWNTGCHPGFVRRYLSTLPARLLFLTATASCLFSTHVLIAQPISPGIKGGLYLTDWHSLSDAGPSGQGASNAGRAVVGPFVRLKLPLELGIQFEALAREYDVRRTSGRAGYSFDYRASGSAWEFPLLLVYRVPFTARGWKPVLSAGPAWRRLSADFSSVSVVPPGFPNEGRTERSGDLSETKAGFQIGGGAEWSSGPITISAEVRYARWAVTQDLNLPSNRNQAVILIGARWR